MLLIINRIISSFLSVICAVTSFFGIPDADKIEARQYSISGSESCEVGDGRVAVHDPSIIQDNDGTYYIFGTHGCSAESDDLRNWKNISAGINDSNSVLVPEGKTLRHVLSEPLSWTDAYQQVMGYKEEQWQTNIWAADVIYNEDMGKYCYYGSSSVWGTTGSVIWMAVSDNIKGPYEYEASLVYSGFNRLTNDGKYYSRVNSLHYTFTNIAELFRNGVYTRKELENAPWFTVQGEYNSEIYPNCIDPALFYDGEGNLWMCYGSYFGGIYLMPMVEKTGMPDYEYMKEHSDYDMYFGKRIIALSYDNELSGEGPYITYDGESGYYYLFVSYGGLGALGGYNTRIYRSRTVDGPYTDAAGKSSLINENTGAKLFGNYKLGGMEQAYLSGGHSSTVISSDGEILHAYHTRFNNGSEGYQTRVHQMMRTADGWLTVLPFEYSGEGAKPADKSEICGEYEFVNHGKITNGCSDVSQSDSIVSPTQKIEILSDGSVSGIRAYESTKENTAVSFREVSGTWTAENGYISFVIDGITYEGVIVKQQDESGTGAMKTVFSAVGEDNSCIWGVKS